MPHIVGIGWSYIYIHALYTNDGCFHAKMIQNVCLFNADICSIYPIISLFR